ncbi:bifunctional molybdenum cofactor biosynthesis protein MoaC/MoaB [Turneriella parva]|uniref:Cyclic pyranopterin monophosphate synthase subunit MoaC n=1 Tax=Turneriella parva (strain ATCC BAA-1111 / DSM 21527 / NCTC 11395 / H) TaxID=869212 RepID=I4B767_TURPD|nr:bifunctional molybdenum cofactor biosynthesis protein MoaC/MoaB [Turneriella parva]AFM13124.1 cyclic pyranopterin monophosphate synthase subunit MoaC [Turneriella parva DSM 21527]
MNDITRKNASLRTATATATVHCSATTLRMIQENTLPKGNLFDVARAAGLLGAKATSALIPHCHPVPIEHLGIDFVLEEAGEKARVVVKVFAQTVYKTGIEIEAMTAATVTALTVFDLLKPVDHELEISGVRLIEKTGGKADRKKLTGKGHTAAILVCSDSVSQGKRDDTSGKIIKAEVEKYEANVTDFKIVPDDIDTIQKQVRAWVAAGVEFIFVTGGTGLSLRDQAIEAIAPLLEKVADGIGEKMRHYGNERTPLAMFSRSLAGSIGKSFIICLPGSSNGARESLDAILPAIFHANAMLHGGGH